MKYYFFIKLIDFRNISYHQIVLLIHKLLAYIINLHFNKSFFLIFYKILIFI